MKIYNQDKTQQLEESAIDYALGHLVDDKLFVAHHEATAAIPKKTIEQKLAEYRESGREVYEYEGDWYVVTQIYESGGKESELIQSTPAIPAQDAYDDYEDIQVFVPYTAEELKERADRKRSAELKAELAKIKEDIEQENFGLVRDDFAEKKARAAQIVNELRVIEGKEPREIRTQIL